MSSPSPLRKDTSPYFTFSTETLCPSTGEAAPSTGQSRCLPGRIWVPWAPSLLPCGEGQGPGCSTSSAGQQDHTHHHSGQLLREEADRKCTGTQVWDRTHQQSQGAGPYSYPNEELLRVTEVCLQC